MLGTIAKKLRMLGFDSRYYTTIDDDKLILIAKKENLTIITKDHALAVNAIQHDIPTIQIHTHTEKEQLMEIAKAIGWKRFCLDISSVRCSLCNGVLESVPKQDIMDELLPRIAESVQEFWKCNECGHIYWVGTHIRNLEKLFAEINDKL